MNINRISFNCCKKWKGDIMNVVNGIKEKIIIDDIKEYLKNKEYRDYMLFFLGVNTGLRISDLIKLQVYEVKDRYGIKNEVIIKEKKTGKTREIPVTEHVKKELWKYVFNMRSTDYLFQSKIKKNMHIKRHRAYMIMKDIQREFNLTNLGTHSLRKTFGYHFYNDTKDIATLMLILNHSSEASTLKYIGIDKERILKAMNKIKL